MSISRREFLEAATLGGLAGSTASAAPTPLPKRVLGPTGARVSILAFGCGSRFLTYTEEQGIEALNRALDLGINYIDTAQSYGKGESERRIGQVLKTRRKEVFLATKVDSRNGEQALRSVEASLQRLQTGHVDLLHIHSLADDKDLAAIEAPDGVLKVLYKLRDQKVARAIGITCHSDPRVLKTALERNDFDCTQMALNAALAGGDSWNPAPEVSFQSVALPVANRRKMGVLAMKVFAQGKLAGDAPAEKLLRYSMSLPVAAAVVSMSELEYIDANVAVARYFKRLPKAEMLELSRDISGKHKLALDRFFRNHLDV